MTTLHKFIEDCHIEVEMMRVSERPDKVDFGNGARHFAVIMRMGGVQGKAIMLWYSQGSAHKERPTAADILESLHSDTDTFFNYEKSGVTRPTYREWCDEFGYDCDSLKVFDLYEACKEEYEKMKWLLGDSIRRFYGYVMTEHFNEENEQ